MENGSEPKQFDHWAIVEIMGHSRYAGRVSEQAIGGCAFVRVDVPAVDGREAFTKLFGPSAIFCITVCSEEVATVAAQQCQAKPVTIYAPYMQSQLDYEDEDATY